MMKRLIAAVAALCMLGSAWAAAEETTEKKQELAGHGIVVMHNREVKETDKQKLAMDYPTFEGEDGALAAYLTDTVTTPFLALPKVGQMAEDSAYQNGAKDFIRSGYYASMDFDGILSLEMTVSNRAAGQQAQETLFVYHIIDLARQRALTIYDLFAQDREAVDAALRQAVYSAAQAQGEVSPQIADAGQVPMPNSFFLTTEHFRCIYGAGTLRQDAALVDIPWGALGLTQSPLLGGEAAAPQGQDAGEAEEGSGAPEEDPLPEESQGNGQAVLPQAGEPEEDVSLGIGQGEEVIPAFQENKGEFEMPPVQTPTPMPVAGEDVNIQELLTRGLWKRMGTEGTTYYQFTADGKLLVVNVEDYSLQDGALSSESISGQVILGGDTAFTLEADSQQVGYVLNRTGIPIAPEELVTPSPTPVPTPTPEPTATPTPTPTVAPTPTLSPYEMARQQAPTLAALGDAAFDKRQTLKVYSAPSEDAYRESPWQVTTDDSVGIYGVENGWVLVSYEIGNGKRGRMGYIDTTTLQDPQHVAALGLVSMEVPLTKDAAATDDPLKGKGKITTLKKDTTVKLLAFLGSEWAYVETTLEGKVCRLFIPQKSLMAE